MKIILSRKGFDSVNGGCPSPIFPDGSMASFPIPDARGSHTMREINCGNINLGDVARDLTQNLNPKNPLGTVQSIHLDPYLRCTRLNTPSDWLPAFGQDGAAQGVLSNQHVTEQDIFLFFGWFRRVEYVAAEKQMHWRYVRNAPDLHVVFGWLQIGQVIEVGANPMPGSYPTWLDGDHPHIQDAHRYRVHNTIYIASSELIVGNTRLGLPGGGAFGRFKDALRLTHPNGPTRTVWQLPSWFSRSDSTGKPTMTFNSNANQWTVEAQYPTKVALKSAYQGQEFVLSGADQGPACDWLQHLFDSNQNSSSDKSIDELSQHVHPPVDQATEGGIARRFSKVLYSELKSKQRENFNFQTVSALLANYGFMTIRVSSDWQSADFIAQHVDGVTFLKVQLKGSFAIDKKFEGKDLFICFPDRPFPDRSIWYLCPHDMLVSEARTRTNICHTDAWITGGTYRAAKPPVSLIPFLDQYALVETK